MKLQNVHKEILEYLGKHVDKHGSVNTFKLSRELGINRTELINIVKELTKAGLTEFKKGVVTKADKECLVVQKIIKSEEVEQEKPISEPKQSAPETPKKSEILKCKRSELENIKGKIKRLKDNWLKKEEELKKVLGDLETQRNKVAQKLAKERRLFYKIQKEKKEIEKNLTERENSLNQREGSIQKREEDIQKREKSVSAARRRFKKEREKISKAKVLKKEIHKLEATLDDLKKKASIKEEKSKQPKEKKAKPKAVSKRIKKPKRKEQIQKKEKYKLEKREEPKLGEQIYEKIGLEEEKIEDIPISGFENVFETKPPDQLEPSISERPEQGLEKKSFPGLKPADFEEPEEITPTIKSKISGVFQKIKVSKTETEKPEIIAKELLQPAAESVKEKFEDKFHDLIEQEISLLKQKRIDEARAIHFQIRDMINEVTDPEQRKVIVRDWNRIKGVY